MERQEDAHDAKRVAVACETCRKRKRKCDGAKPVCSTCSSRELECQYADQSASRKRKQWSLDYVSTLEETISTLKGYISDLQEHGVIGETPANINGLLVAHLDSEKTSSFDTVNAMTSAENEDLHVRSPGDKAISERRLPSAIDEMSAMIWKMNICEDGTSTFTGPSGNFCFEPPAGRMLPVVQSRVHPSKSAARTDYLQDHSLKEELISLFMTKVNSYHQFVNPFLKSAEETNGPDLHLLRISMCTAGSSYSQRPDASAVGQAFAENAENIALTCCRTLPSLSTVQALSILCWYELGQDHDNMAWVYNSTASAVALHLGLHVIGFERLAGGVSSNAADQHERIRTFWSLSLMDRIATSTLGRQCVMPWRRTRVPSLLDILDHSAGPDEIAFGHQCKLWFLHDQFMDQIYAFDFDELNFEIRNKILVHARENLFNFHQGIDERLHEMSTHHSIVFFKMSYQTSLLLIHRPYMREDPGSSSYRLALRSMTAAAAQMTRLIRMFRKTGNFVDAPPFVIHHILTASIMHLLNATTLEPSIRQQSIGRFRVCVDALEEMQPMWQHARRAVRLLQGLAQRWAVVFALPIRLSNPLSSIDQETLESVSLVALPELAQVDEHTTASHHSNQSTSFDARGDAVGDDWSFALSDGQFDQNASIDINALWDFSEYPDLSQAPGFEWMGGS
ncbi:uncharacterized protein BDZ99DRAFT_499213 [Mytilinidion resinicola]|uniref:Zn(2)-C6 fungal-type domain-containing protein n=1 Tax=Mytilinidion resinicola TaxID=574789 RepID=A0A6A6YJU4_9PEZI|nr:uncharacterized protein BDZ99DRAFT_499213 [Mytilinidion resinicola]KAF2808829.1 hypothetical protein BDZ99DRAFT_499213 [Mytilinidion resinicola]